MSCTCNSGFRYVKGVAVPCKKCNPNGKILKLTVNEEENTVSTENVENRSIEEILCIPDVYSDKSYSRAKINLLLRGLTQDRLFDKLDSILLDVRKGIVHQENCFFFAPQRFDIDTWVYTFLKDAYTGGIPVLPYISADVLKGLWQLSNEPHNLSNEVKDSLDYLNVKLGITWYDLLMGKVLVIKLPATFNNSVLTILMSLVSQRILYNNPTYVVSYWKSDIVRKSNGGGFIFKDEANYGMNLFSIYEHTGTMSDKNTYILKK